MKTLLLLLATCVGCAHNVAPPVDAHALPSLPPQTVGAVIPISNTQYPCGQQTSVHVGKLDVDLPKGIRLDIPDLKGEVGQYHLVLEDLTFSHQESCR